MKNTFEKLILALIKCHIGFEIIHTEKAIIAYFHNFRGESFFFVLIKEDTRITNGTLVLLTDISKESLVSPQIYETRGDKWESYILEKSFCYFSKVTGGGIGSRGEIEKEINEQNFNTDFVKELDKILKF